MKRPNPHPGGRQPQDATRYYREVQAPNLKGTATHRVRIAVYNDGRLGFGIGEEWRQFSKVAVYLTPDNLDAILVAIGLGQEWSTLADSTNRKNPKPRRLVLSWRMRNGKLLMRLAFYNYPDGKWKDYVNISVWLEEDDARLIALRDALVEAKTHMEDHGTA